MGVMLEGFINQLTPFQIAKKQPPAITPTPTNIK
jgi:hypothetical protein